MKLILGLSVLLCVFATSCGKAGANSAKADLVPSPLAGYKCFIVYDGEGRAVGGNCVKE